LGFFILFNNLRNLQNKILFIGLLTFAAWVFLDSVFWASNRGDIIMFVWAAILVLEPLVYAALWYLNRVFITGQDVSFNYKILVGLLFVPLIIFLPTDLALQSFDITTCLAVEGPIALYYTYIIEIILSLSVIIFSIRQYKKILDWQQKKKILYMTFGTVIFLIAFASGNIIGSSTGNWTVAQYGLFGMPVFMGFLTYLIVEYKAFNIKLIATQALVVILIVLIGSQFAFQDSVISIVLTSITLVGVMIFGIFLVKSVKREIDQRERLQKLTFSLEDANEKLKGLDKLKTEFLSLASHQLRSPLTAIKGYSSMLLDGSYGPITDEKQKEAVSRVFQSSQNLAKTVEDLLNVSKIEQGGMKYEMSMVDMEKLVKGVSDELSVSAKDKKLEYDFKTDGEEAYLINGDSIKLRQVLVNLIDNSIKYTPAGFIHIKLAKSDDKKKIIFSISDSGIGMTDEIKSQLFQKFSRGIGGKVNAGGSGLGLYLVKEIVEAHKGRVWIESAGLDKGSQFYVEFNSL
jgi:signal transduction histidine kinase